MSRLAISWPIGQHFKLNSKLKNGDFISLSIGDKCGSSWSLKFYPRGCNSKMQKMYLEVIRDSRKEVVFVTGLIYVYNISSASHCSTKEFFGKIMEEGQTSFLVRFNQTLFDGRNFSGCELNGYLIVANSPEELEETKNDSNPKYLYRPDENPSGNLSYSGLYQQSNEYFRSSSFSVEDFPVSPQSMRRTQSLPVRISAGVDMSKNKITEAGTANVCQSTDIFEDNHASFVATIISGEVFNLEQQTIIEESGDSLDLSSGKSHTFCASGGHSSSRQVSNTTDDASSSENKNEEILPLNTKPTLSTENISDPVTSANENSKISGELPEPVCTGHKFTALNSQQLPSTNEPSTSCVPTNESLIEDRDISRSEAIPHSVSDQMSISGAESCAESKYKENMIFTSVATMSIKMESCKEKLSTDLLHMLETGNFADATLSCGSKTFRVHRNILASRSPIFEEKFRNSVADTILKIDDVDPEMLHDLLFFIYGGVLGTLTDQSACRLLSGSAKYRLDDLHDICSEHLKTSMSMENILDILIAADNRKNVPEGKCNEDLLKSAAIEFACSNFKVLQETEQWKGLRQDQNELVIEVMEKVIQKWMK